MTRTLVVVGHGMVGHQLVDRLRSLDTERTWRIVVLGEERHLAYDRVALSSYLDGKSKDDLTLAGPDLLHDARVDVRLACPAVSVDRTTRTVRTADGNDIAYDALVLACGSRPFVPPVPGHDLTGCFVYRTFDDLDAIRAAARAGRPGVVIGGGLLGLEAANALRLLGMRPHIVETAPHLMPAQLDPGAAHVLHQQATDLGLQLHCATATASVEAHPDGTVHAVRLSDGTVLETGLVVFAAGIRPRDELAAPAGLALGERGGIAVDDRCRTHDGRVWAIGECAAVEGRCHGLVAPGYRMADNVAHQLMGHDTEPFDGSDTATTLKLLGVNVASFGATRPAEGEALEVVFAEGTTRYAKFFLRQNSGALLGGILAGGTASPLTLASFIGRQPPPDLEQLLVPQLPFLP
ncbi:MULTISPECIES: NAD(P)/FAD-dependent oxidoreductase [unclassified Streptomyces]|uniref:NAD(P)/FAD-dependent oxidoreductase n=1 Tax=unclassified Streptomyces TaxID=2593676 RepID=UPI0037F74BAE